MQIKSISYILTSAVTQTELPSYNHNKTFNQSGFNVIDVAAHWTHDVCCDVESTSLTLIQSHNNVVGPVEVILF